MSADRANRFLPGIEALEDRQLLSAVSVLHRPLLRHKPHRHSHSHQQLTAPIQVITPLTLVTTPATTPVTTPVTTTVMQLTNNTTPVPALNQKVLAFAQAHLGQRVGGGECAHLANEALRVAGANYLGADPHGDGNYVWGNLVTSITAQNGQRTDANPGAGVQPGDIIQFRDVVMSNGATYGHHTAIVATVDASGRPTSVYEQNVGASGKGGLVHDRFVRLDPMSFSNMTSGTVWVYRPVTRTDVAGRIQFTVVNNTTQPQTVTISLNGFALGNVGPLDVANTAGSYTSAWYSSSGSGSWTISVAGHSVALNNAGGYEIYTLSNGQTGIRQI